MQSVLIRSALHQAGDTPEAEGALGEGCACIVSCLNHTSGIDVLSWAAIPIFTGECVPEHISAYQRP